MTLLNKIKEKFFSQAVEDIRPNVEKIDPKVEDIRPNVEDTRMINFKQQFQAFKSLVTDNRFVFSEDDFYPCLDDATGNTNFDAHYIYHPAWAARIVKKITPPFHIDISSTLHFCSILSAFIPVEFYDYRPADLTLDNLHSKRADLTNLHFEDNSILSLSCMHTIEHIGLGRYGDPIDPQGDLKAIEELKRVCAVGGNLLFVVPVGIPKIMFNAHRIYHPKMILTYFDNFTLENFALITDQSKYIEDATIEMAENQIYGCGCYWLKKK